MKIILTGKVNTGKTTVLKKLEKEIPIFILDEYVNFIYQKDKIGYILISKKISEDYVNENGVDKKALLAYMKKDPSHRENIEKLIHPVLTRKTDSIKEGFIEAPIIFSNYYNPSYDKIVFLEKTKNWNPNEKISSLFEDIEENSSKYDHILKNNDPKLVEKLIKIYKQV